MIYFIIAAFLIFLVFDEINFYNFKKSQFISIIIAIILILLAGLRHKVGTDWEAYFQYYQHGVKGIEFGYSYLNNLFGIELGFHYNFFLCVMNLVALAFMVKSSWKLSPLPILALLIYFSDLFLYFNLSGFRQALATSFSCYAITYTFGARRNIFKFLLLIGIASSFHVTALITIVAYFIPQRRLVKREYFFGTIGFMFFSSIIYFATSFLSGIFASKAEYYLELQDKAADIEVLFIIGTLRRSIPLLLIIIFGKDKFFSNPVSSFVFNLYLIGFGIFLSSYLISPDIGVRVSSYFIIMEIFMLGHLLYILKGTKKATIVLLIIVLVSLYKISTYSNNLNFEYQSIL